MAWSQPQSQPRTRTLLVVDDREANLVAMEALLGDGDWQVHTVNSGEAALQALLDLETVKRNNWATEVSPAVEEILGRPPETFAAFLENNPSLVDAIRA